MLKSHRSFRIILSLAACALGATAIAVPEQAVAQGAAQTAQAAGPRLRAERTPLAVTFRGEKLNSAPKAAAHRRTTIQISLLAVVVGVILLVLLL